MQIDPESTDFTGPVGGPVIHPPIENVSVAQLTSLSGTLLGIAFFDRTTSPNQATTFGRDTDNWHWITTGSEWPSTGFRLRTRRNPPYEPLVGDYATWSDRPFAPTTTGSTVPRYRVVQENPDGTEVTLGELLVEKVGRKWRQTWWAEAAMLTANRLQFKVDLVYRFEPISGPSALGPNTLRVCALPPVPTKRVTPG